MKKRLYLFMSLFFPLLAHAMPFETFKKVLYKADSQPFESLHEIDLLQTIPNNPRYLGLIKDLMKNSYRIFSNPSLIHKLETELYQHKLEPQLVFYFWRVVFSKLQPLYKVEFLRYHLTPISQLNLLLYLYALGVFDLPIKIMANEKEFLEAVETLYMHILYQAEHRLRFIIDIQINGMYKLTLKKTSIDYKPDLINFDLKQEIINVHKKLKAKQ